MDKGKKILRWLLPALAVFVTGFAVAAFFDLPINLALYRPTSPISIFMEAMGWFPAFLPVYLLAVLWAADGWQSQPRRTPMVVVGALLAAAVAAVLFRTAYSYFAKRGTLEGTLDWRGVAFLAAGVFLFLWLARWVFQQKGPVRYKLRFAALFGSVFMMANQVLINGVKLVWQRSRFDTMLAGGALDSFTPWYQLGNGGSSFPSAHTANAAGIFCLLVLCDVFPRWNRNRKLIYGICWGYIALMAASRVVIGRHFLSDTLAGAGLIALLFWGMRSTPVYKRNVLQARKGMPAREDEGIV